MDEYVLDEDAVRRTAEIVRQVERDVKPSDWNARRGLPAGALPPMWACFNPTAAPSSDIYYTGNIVVWDGVTEIVLATGLRGIGMNSSALTIGTRYPARITGTTDSNGVQVFSVDDFSGGGGTSGFTGTKQVCEGDGLLHTWTFSNGLLISAP